MLNLIVAVDQNYGIGMKNKLPWKCPAEMKKFKETTMNSYILIGPNTFSGLPSSFFTDRKPIVLIDPRKTLPLPRKDIDPILISNFEELGSYTDFPIFVCGGAKTYKHALTKTDMVTKVYLSVLKGKYECDSFFDKSWLSEFHVVGTEEYDDYTRYILEKNVQELQYLNLLRKLTDLEKTKCGRNGNTKSLFVEHLSFDLRLGFPLLTTKKMFFRGIVEEFLFFVRGNTDTNILKDKGVHIWDGNTSNEFLESRGLKYNEGVMGPMYGYQWRYFGSEYLTNEEGQPLCPQGGVDQLAKVVDLIKNDPGSRRILMTTFNPAQAEMGVLYPCHSISIQFSVDDIYLDMFCFNRSQDVFLGVPYNIASSALLLTVVSSLTNKTPRHLKITMGDTHLYESHINQAQIQMTRVPYAFPKLRVKPLSSLDIVSHLASHDFVLEGYNSHSVIKAEMVV